MCFLCSKWKGMKKPISKSWLWNIKKKHEKKENKSLDIRLENDNCIRNFPCSKSHKKPISKSFLPAKSMLLWVNSLVKDFIRKIKKFFKCDATPLHTKLRNKFCYDPMFIRGDDCLWNSKKAWQKEIKNSGIELKNDNACVSHVQSEKPQKKNNFKKLYVSKCVFSIGTLVRDFKRKIQKLYKRAAISSYTDLRIRFCYDPMFIQGHDCLWNGKKSMKKGRIKIGA